MNIDKIFEQINDCKNLSKEQLLAIKKLLANHSAAILKQDEETLERIYEDLEITMQSPSVYAAMQSRYGAIADQDIQELFHDAVLDLESDIKSQEDKIREAYKELNRDVNEISPDAAIYVIPDFKNNFQDAPRL